MYNENVGTFRGRVEDGNRLQVSKAQLINYLSNVDKRLSDVESMIKKAGQGSKMQEFLTKYQESLSKAKKFMDEAKKYQIPNQENQMNL